MNFKIKIKILFIGIGLIFSYSITTIVSANSTSNFTLQINPGTLSVDIVDDSEVSVTNPSVQLSAVSVSESCQTATGTFGSSTEKIYISNQAAANDGWTVNLAASSTVAYWESSGTGATFDFNDPTTSGCADGGDADAIAGELTVDPSGGTLSTSTCLLCGLTGVSLGSSDSFDEGSTDSITVVSATAGSDNIGDWEVIGIDISQTIPGNQAAASDYSIDMVLSIIAS